MTDNSQLVVDTRPRRSGFHRALTLAVALGVMASSARAQDPAIVARFDSLQQRMLLQRFPCPVPVPSGWVAADSANGHGIPCSLIAAAARGANEGMFGRRRLMDPHNVLCVTLAQADPIPPYGPLWRVVFYADSVRGSVLTIDHSGRTITGMMLVSLDPLVKVCRKT